MKHDPPGIASAQANEFGGEGNMKRSLTAVALAAVLTLGGGAVATAQDTDTSVTEEATNDDGDTGLFGLAGLLGLIGLAGLKRRDRSDHVRTGRDEVRR
ncbi:MAG: WGxxGxxG family protein [Actinomycetota bacterium]